ncbi:hypothetical protein V6O07_16355, partial [Arthrospira platensis SPKY2]
ITLNTNDSLINIIKNTPLSNYKVVSKGDIIPFGKGLTQHLNTDMNTITFTINIENIHEEFEIL